MSCWFPIQCSAIHCSINVRPLSALAYTVSPYSHIANTPACLKSQFNWLRFHDQNADGNGAKSVAHSVIDVEAKALILNYLINLVDTVTNDYMIVIAVNSMPEETIANIIIVMDADDSLFAADKDIADFLYNDL